MEHFTGNYTVFLFATHTVIITGVYIGAFRQRHHANPALILLLFYLCFYNHSLNIMRQYMAMAIVFAALADIEQKKYLRFIVVVIIARYIHTSALLALGALAIHWVLYGSFIGLASSLRPSVRARMSTVVVGLSILVFMFPIICRFLISAGILQSKYLFFLNVDEAEHTTINTLFLLVEMIAIFVFRKQLTRRDPYFKYFLLSSVSYLILHQLSAVLVFGKRVAAYYSLGNLVSLAMIPQSFRNKQNRIIAIVLLLCVVFVFWWYVYILRNGNGTYPYVSILQNA